MSTSSFTIKVLLFASAREAAGNVSMVHVELQEGSDAFQLRQLLATMYPTLATMVLDDDSITLAVNEEYVTDNTLVLQSGDTVALIPPISGG